MSPTHPDHATTTATGTAQRLEQILFLAVPWVQNHDFRELALVREKVLHIHVSKLNNLNYK